jgi:hypothetical protein
MFGMPEDVLLELETTPSVAGGLEGVEDLVRAARLHEDQVRLAVQGLKGSALLFEKVWRRIVMDVASGQTLQMQAARPQLASAFDRRLRVLRETHAVAAWLRNLGSAELPDPDVLLPEIAGMERLKSTTFDRWQAADDLEDLAARDYPLTTPDLDRIGPQRRPPASYFAQESKPF